MVVVVVMALVAAMEMIVVVNTPDKNPPIP